MEETSATVRDDFLFSVRVHPDARYVLEPGIGADGAALLEVAGAANAYALLCDRFVGTEDRELFDCARRTTRVAAVSPTEIVTRWEVSFVPEKIRWMVALGDVARSVEFYDILHLMDQRSRFTWRGLFRVFTTAALEKKMRVPMAKIEGTTRCRFELGSNDAASPSLIATEETVDLIGHINAEQRVQNKRLARDALAFLDAQTPRDVARGVGRKSGGRHALALRPRDGPIRRRRLGRRRGPERGFRGRHDALSVRHGGLLTFAWAFGGGTSTGSSATRRCWR